MRRIALIFLACQLILGAVCSAQAKTSLMLDWHPNPNHATLVAAKTQGFFERLGLDVDFQVPADPNDPLKLVAAGQVDFAVSYQPAAIQARAQGLPVVAIGALVQHPLSCVLYLEETGISSPKDFKGLEIGYSVEPLYRVLFETMASQAGLDPDDYSSVRVGFNLTQPLLSGKIAGAAGAFRNYEAIQAGLRGFEVGIFAFENYGVPDFYELVLITSQQTVDQQPGKVRRFYQAVEKGTQWTLANPKLSRQAFFRAYPDNANELNKRAFTATLPFFQGSPKQEKSRWRDLQRFMLKKGLIKGQVETGDLVWQP